MLKEFTIEQMQSVYATFMQDYSQLKQQCEAAVVETRIANGRMICPAPLFDQIAKNWSYWEVPRRHWVQSAEETTVTHEHGFDKEGVLRIYENYYLFYEDNLIYEVMDGEVICYVLDSHGVADAVYEFHGHGDRLFVEERFSKESHRVIKSIKKKVFLDDEDLSGHDFQEICEYEYDEGGMLSRVVERTYRDGELRRTKLRFTRQTNDTLEASAQSLENFLVEQIPRVVQQHETDSPLFAVFLCYSGVDFATEWPGCLAVATENIRDEHLHGHPDDIWEVEEWWRGSWLQMCDSDAQLELEEKAMQVLQLIDSPDVWLTADLILSMRQILHRVAFRLNRTNWSENVRVTDDFAVTVAVIDNADDFDVVEDLAGSLPPEKIKKLRSKGFLSGEAKERLKGYST
jgi:hypothetical protein